MAQPSDNAEPFTRHPTALTQIPASGPETGITSSLIERAQGALYVGPPRRTIGNDDAIFDHNNPKIKEDILKMITQYLQDEGYFASMMTVQDEANVKINEQVRNRSHFKRIKAAILDGEWAEVEKMVQKTPLKDHKTFLYNVYKEQFLELIDQFEYQKAFALLTKRLKPLEQVGAQNNDFKNLCYLLTCKCIQDAPLNWEGVAASREKLVEQFSSMLEMENSDFEVARQEMQQHRLLHMLKQAVRYQIEFSRYHPKVIPNIPTLLEDYSCFILPNAHKTTFKGHRSNVKCVDFVGEEGSMLVSGSSDNTLQLWDVESGSHLRVLGDGAGGTGNGHTSRVWDVTSNTTGDLIISASGDSTIKLWNLGGTAKFACSSTLLGHEGDVYSAKFHHSNNFVVTGGYDKTVRLWDLHSGTLVRTFSGHNSAVSRVIFNPLGNLVISGSKDSTIKFWDVVSGVCIKTYSSHLGEVTSVEMNKAGSLLLSGSKDNSNRLWDVRLARPVRRFKGHQNTSKNFVRASFGPDEALIVGGSEDGLVFIWDAATGEVLQRLGSNSSHSHQGIAYRAVWNPHQSLLASCSHDSTVKTWWFDEKQPWNQDDDDF